MQQAEGIGFVAAMSVMVRNDMEFVERAFADSGNKAFPDAGTAARAADGCVLGFHPLKLPTTETERAFGAQTLKKVPGLARDRGNVGAHLVVNAVVRCPR